MIEKINQEALNNFKTGKYGSLFKDDLLSEWVALAEESGAENIGMTTEWSPKNKEDAQGQYIIEMQLTLKKVPIPEDGDVTIDSNDPDALEKLDNLKEIKSATFTIHNKDKE